MLHSKGSLSIPYLLFLAVRRPQCRPIDVWVLQVRGEPWREVWRLDAQLGEIGRGGVPIDVRLFLLLPFPVKAPTSTAMSYVNGWNNYNTTKAARRLLAAEQTHILSVKRSCMFAEVESGSVYQIASLTTG